MYNLMIIDDDHELGQLLSEYLRQQDYQVDCEQNPLLALEALKRTSYHLVLLDVMMPQLDGFETLKRLRTFSTVPVIMLTAKGDDYDKILGLELGADDYLPKPFNQRELLARIKALIRRLEPATGFGQEPILNMHSIEVNPAEQSVRIQGNEVAMTASEYLLLYILMKSPGTLQTKADLNEQVLGRKLSAYDRSLDMHISNLRKKLSEFDLQDIIKTKRGTGYMMLRDSLEQGN